MKAIVVLFPGGFLSENHERDAIGNIATILSQTTSVPSIEEIEVYSLDENSISLSLVQSTMKGKTNAVPSLADAVIAYCRSVCNICNPIDHPHGDYKEVFIRNFINNYKLRENKEAIAYLVSNKKLTRSVTEILEKYNLSELPEYLKQLSFLINILLSWLKIRRKK